jgi:putative acetyltransferase
VDDIREARPDEARLLAAVQGVASVAALGHIFPPDLYPYPREAVRSRWVEASADEARRTLIAVSGVEPVGAALVSAEWLDGLYVVPERWGSGLADELHDRALVQGLGSAKCHLWVLEHNARARCFLSVVALRVKCWASVRPFLSGSVWCVRAPSLI